MSTQKKLSEEEIKRKLIADAENPAAWEPPVTVPASRASRPAWYGRSKHLELAAKFYVLSVLHRLGADASLTSAPSDNVDIAAVSKSGEAFVIEVKTLTGKADWPVEPFNAREHHFVVFVRFEQDWHNPEAVPDVYIWRSEELESFIAHRKTATLSLEAVAQKLDPKSAWDQFTAQPAA